MLSDLFSILPHLLFLLSLLTAPYTASAVPAHFCSTDSNFTTNSTYQANLHLLLSSLPSAATANGFAARSVGQTPNQVFGAALCLGYISPDQCQTCLSPAPQDFQELCPLGKSAAIWYDVCFIRYSKTNFSGDSSRVIVYNVANVSEPVRFEDMVANLLDNLTTRAAFGSDRKFATGEANFTGSETIYGLVQCTRDQSADDCDQCLHSSIGMIPQSFWGKQGGVVLGYYCYVRFEIYPYYESLVGEAPPPPLAVTGSPPPASTPPATTEKQGEKKNTVIIALTVISSIAGLIFLSTFFTCFWRRRKSARLINSGHEERNGVNSLLFDFDVLKVATNNFSNANKLGEGGFGPVYKGVLSNGQEIAVKRLSTSSRQGLHELRNEVIFVAKLQHRNLVRLLGCCLQSQEKLLVYEYLPNTSLDKFLFDPNKRGQLGWGRRYKIIEGIARGLHYFHEDSRFKIIHRDLKPSNILLDQDMTPKISDFGLAKLFDGDATHERASRIAGTNGYMAPEYAMHGQFSTKSDVFSYGVLVLEIVTGRGISDFHGSGRDANLLSYMWNLWNKGKAVQAVDKGLGRQYHEQQVLRCIHIGLLCVQEDPRKRPSMGTIVLMLSGFTFTLPTPSMPAFFVEGSTTTKPEVAIRDCDSAKRRKERSDQSKTMAGSLSINDVTISAMEPR